MDSIRFKNDIVNSYEAFKELEKVRLNAVPKKKEWILDQSNLLPDMQNTLRYNINAYEDDFWKNHNQYKLTPHIDFYQNTHLLIMHHKKQDLEALITNLIRKI